MEGECRVGWEAISDCLNKDLSQIDKKVKIVVLECYQGVLDDEVVEALQSFFPFFSLVLFAGCYVIIGKDKCSFETGYYRR